MKWCTKYLYVSVFSVVHREQNLFKALKFICLIQKPYWITTYTFTYKFAISNNKLVYNYYESYTQSCHIKLHVSTLKIIIRLMYILTELLSVFNVFRNKVKFKSFQTKY